MLILKQYEQHRSDKFAVKLMERAQKLEMVKQHKEVNFKHFYVSKLSEEYRYSRKILFETIHLDGLTVECISKKNEESTFALIQLHGGAYIYEYNDTYRKSAKWYLERKKNLKVFSPIYSLAPKKPYPYALHEVVRLYEYILKQGFKPEHIIIAGDSAGGGLAIASTLYLRDHDIPLPKALITMSAWTNLAMNGESHEKNKYVDPMFGVGSVPLDVDAYVGKHDVTNPYISPKYGDFKKFTDMLMFVGGNEIIESDTLDVANLAKENHEVCVHDFIGMFHVFPFGFNKMSSSKKAWEIIFDYMNEKLKDDE